MYDIMCEFETIDNLKLIISSWSKTELNSNKHLFQSYEVCIPPKNCEVTMQNIVRMDQTVIDIFQLVMSWKTTVLTSQLQYKDKTVFDEPLMKAYLDIIENSRYLKQVNIFTCASHSILTQFKSKKHKLSDIVSYVKERVDPIMIPFDMDDKIVISNEDDQLVNFI